MNRAIGILAALLLAAAGCFSAREPSPRAEDPAGSEFAVATAFDSNTALEGFYGKIPPELSITDARGAAKNVKLADFRGKWVLLDFWGLSCQPCIKESLPRLSRFYEEHAADRDRFEILTVCNNWSHDVKTMEEFDLRAAPIVEKLWDGKPLPFPVLLDGDEKTFDAYGITAVPTTLLIDPDGNLVGEADEEMLAEKLNLPKP